MRLVAYARYSSDNQREESITAQLRAIHKWADENGHIIEKEYTDEALSARTDKRPNFLQMIEDSKIKNWDGVVVHKLDRFSRNRYNSAIYKKILKSTGKRIYSVLERLDDSPESIIMESLLEGMNEYYSANLSREVKKGLNENALVCKHNGGLPPLGYGVDESLHYYIIEKEARAVKLIFNKYLEGVSYKEICEDLKNNGFKTKTGKDFKLNSIHDILRNEKYTGVYIYGYGARSKIRGCPGENMIKIENGMPKIIEKSTFDLVQEKMKGRRFMGNTYKAKHDYLLSGLIKCGQCGNKYVGSAKSKTRIVYECSGKRTTNCTNSYVRKETIETAVFNKLKDIFCNEDNLLTITEKFNKFYNKLYCETENDRKEAENELAEINNKINNINNAIINGFYNSSMNEQSKQLEKEKEIIETKLFMINNVANKPKMSLSDIQSLLNKDLLVLENNSPAEQKAIINKYVKQIVINNEDIDIQVIFGNDFFLH